MIIRYKKNAESERAAANTFEAYDDLENYLGEASVESVHCPFVLPARPCVFTVRLQGNPAAGDALLGAATAHALYLARDAQERCCVRVEVRPGEQDRLAPALEALGYGGKSAILRMSTPVRPGPVTVPIPEGLTVVRDYLNDEKERAFYLERVNALFGGHRDEKWMADVRAKQHFTRMLLIDEHGAAGEMITWAEGSEGVVENIWVHPDWRGKGAGKFLLEFARIYWLECALEGVHMDVWSRLQPAIHLAYAAGFQPSEAILEYPYMDTK